MSDISESPNRNLAKHEEQVPTPACPDCGMPMRLASAIWKLPDLPEGRTYDCKPCGVAVTEWLSRGSGADAPSFLEESLSVSAGDNTKETAVRPPAR